MAFPFGQSPQNLFGPMPQIGLTPEDFYPLRAQSIYDPTVTGDLSMPTQDAGMEMMTLLSQLYKPESKMSDLYQAALQQMPEREQPSRLRRIGAAIAGLGAGVRPSAYSHGAALGLESDPEAQLKTQDQFLNRRYYEKLGDWKTRTEMLGKGALEEEKSNINKRSLALGEAARITSARRAEDYSSRVAAQNQKAIADAQKNIDKLQQDMKIAEMKNAQDVSEMQSRAKTAEATLKQREHEANMKVLQANLDRQIDRLKYEETVQKNLRDYEVDKGKLRQGEQRMELLREWNTLRNAGKDVTMFEYDAEGLPIGKKETKTRPIPVPSHGPPPGVAHGETTMPLTKTQTNSRTGEKRTLISTDGGKTWKVQQ